MDQPILVDTDVLIEYLRGRAEAVEYLRGVADRILLSSIVVAELYAGVRDGSEQAILDEFIALFRIVPVTAPIARAAGLLKRDFARSHGTGLADAILAASAQAEGATLATLNVRHYPMFKGLRPAYGMRQRGASGTLPDGGGVS